MPHTTRTKDRSIKKHRHVEGDDGWTHVTRGPNHRGFGGRALPPGLIMPSLPGMEGDEDGIPRSTVRRGLTEEEVEHLIATTARKWTESSLSADIKHVFERQLSKLRSLEISSCVCLALGSFTADDFHGRPSASMNQLVAVEAMLQILRRKHKIDKVYFQDPCFNDLDEKVLRSRGYSILQRPTALEYITPSTFLYAPFATWTSLISALQMTEPGLVVTNDIRQHLHERYVFDAPGNNTIHVNSLSEQYPNGDYGYPQENGEAVLRNFIDSRTTSTLSRSASSLQVGLNDLTIYWKPEPTDTDSLN
ncbi:hypothetical protein MMC18_008340 [Xylographa bjoerkii]|nr:hypothetical protein [Xylographa bjoerkii]